MVVSDSQIRARVLTLGLEIASAELVTNVYAGLQTSAIAGTALAQVNSLLGGVNLPPDISASLDSLRTTLSAGGDKAVPIINAVTLSGNSASTLASTHSDVAAESYLEMVKAGSVPESRLVRSSYSRKLLHSWVCRLEAGSHNSDPVWTMVHHFLPLSKRATDRLLRQESQISSLLAFSS
jgi:hypothetical protein